MNNTTENALSALAGDHFGDVVPDFSYSVNGSRISVRVMPILGADSYELYRSKTARGKYEPVISSPSPLIDIICPDNSSYHYKVRAVRGSEGGASATKYSRPQYVDIVSSAKERDAKLYRFYEMLKDLGGTLSFEDLDVAIESLKVAGLEIREHEKRHRLEEEAEKRKKDLEAENKRRQAAARRAEAIREKKRREHVESVTRMELRCPECGTANVISSICRITSQL